MEKSFRVSIVLSLLAIVGFCGLSAAKPLFSRVAVEDECSLTASEILEVQGQLAQEESYELSFVISSTIDISYTQCDGSQATGGTITLDIGNVPQTWNWTFERTGGGNIIIIWPAE